MDPVSDMESRLGPIDLWPSYIPRFLFVDAPNAATVRRVVAFFYGNGIEYGTAAHFFCLCNGQSWHSCSPRNVRLLQQVEE
jgi:hypothetical protein